MTLGVVKVQGDGAAALLHVGGAVQAHHGLAIAVGQIQQLPQQPFGEAVHPGLDGVYAHFLQVAQTGFHGGNAQVVQRAVFKTRLTAGEHMHAPLHGGKVHRATAKPGAAQGGERVIAHQQTTHTGGVAEHFVEGHDHKVGRHGAQIEAVGGYKGCRVQQHLPAFGLRRLNECQRVLHAGKVRLCWKRK